MTPAGFDYLQPTSIGEALEMVGLHPDTRFLAGGHALLPDSVLPERHRRHPHPSALVDLGRIAELRGIQILQDAGSPHGGDSSGAGRLVRIGAMTTTADIEYSPDIARAVPLLSQAAAQISDPLIRNRATLGGSLAEADPHGDWPPLVLATDATMQLRSRDGERTVPAAGFFTSDRAGPGTGSTTLWPGELLTAVTVPAFDARTRATYLKRMHPATGHAMLGVAAAVTVDADQTCRGCRIAITGAGGVATRAVRAEAQLVGSRLTPETIQGPRTRQATGSSSSATRSVRRLPGRAATPLPQPSAVPAHHPIHTQLTGARTIARTPARADPGVVRTWTTEPRRQHGSVGPHEKGYRQKAWGCIGMLVLVTGGTGYVGAHSIAALASAGHRIRVLARSPASIPAALEPLGADGVETTIGDVTEPAVVERALEGCDAVLHAASLFSTDARKADEINSVNVRGTDIVLGTAHRLGLDPIVYVSSEVALLPPADGEVLTPASPVRRPAGPYCRSKADAELVARKFQALGAPVVSVMPAAVWGPHDPHLGEGVTLAANVLRNRYPIVMPGGMHIVDVRDVAAVLAAVMQPGRGPRSYLVAGHYVAMSDIIGTLGYLSGRRLRFVKLPAWFLAAFGRTADLVQRRLRTRLPWSGESIWIVNCAARCDDSKTRDEFQLEPRPLRETFADTVRWLVETGHLTPRKAGRLA